jgi:hypothetical protein
MEAAWTIAKESKGYTTQSCPSSLSDHRDPAQPDELDFGGCWLKYTPTPMPTAARMIIMVSQKQIQRFRRAERACFTATSVCFCLQGSQWSCA